MSLPNPLTAYAVGFGLGLYKQAQGDFLGGVKEFWGGLAPETQRALIGGGAGLLAGSIFGRGRAAPILGGLAGAGLGYFGQRLLPQLFGTKEPPRVKTPLPAPAPAPVTAPTPVPTPIPVSTPTMAAPALEPGAFGWRAGPEVEGVTTEKFPPRPLLERPATVIGLRGVEKYTTGLQPTMERPRAEPGPEFGGPRLTVTIPAPAGEDWFRDVWRAQTGGDYEGWAAFQNTEEGQDWLRTQTVEAENYRVAKIQNELATLSFAESLAGNPEKTEEVFDDYRKKYGTEAEPGLAKFKQMISEFERERAAGVWAYPGAGSASQLRQQLSNQMDQTILTAINRENSKNEGPKIEQAVTAADSWRHSWEANPPGDMDGVSARREQIARGYPSHNIPENTAVKVGNNGAYLFIGGKHGEQRLFIPGKGSVALEPSMDYMHYLKDPEKPEFDFIPNGEPDENGRVYGYLVGNLVGGTGGAWQAVSWQNNTMTGIEYIDKYLYPDLAEGSPFTWPSLDESYDASVMNQVMDPKMWALMAAGRGPVGLLAVGASEGMASAMEPAKRKVLSVADLERLPEETEQWEKERGERFTGRRAARQRPIIYYPPFVPHKPNYAYNPRAAYGAKRGREHEQISGGLGNLVRDLRIAIRQNLGR